MARGQTAEDKVEALRAELDGDVSLTDLEVLTPRNRLQAVQVAKRALPAEFAF